MVIAMSEARRIGVIVRERQREGLRMAVGLTVLDDAVEVYLMDRPLQGGPEVEQYVEALGLMGATVATNLPDGAFPCLTDAEAAHALAQCDVVIPY